MQRLTYWVIAAISISVVNLVLLVWIIVPPFLFPVSVNSKNETTDRPSIFSSSASGKIDDHRRAIDEIRRDIRALEQNKSSQNHGHGPADRDPGLHGDIY
jgi:hypothetical protein